MEHAIIAAFLFDLLVGDPRWAPHPVRMIGWYGGRLETILRKLCRNERLAGYLCVLIMLLNVSALSLGVLYTAWLVDRSRVVFWITATAMIYWSIATHDLLKHAKEVLQALQADDLAEARTRVGRIVGRDTENLDAAGVTRAAVESVAESIVDGITAPLFFAMLLGPVGAILYRTVNTMDSMFGYMNKRYKDFGRTAARLDDLANFIPARLTAPLLCLAAAMLYRSGKRAFLTLLRDAHNHASPNSGLAEAAMAGALGVQLGGPSVYGGRTLMKPTIGERFERIEPGHIRKAGRVTLVAAALFLVLGLLLRYGLSLLALRLAAG